MTRRSFLKFCFLLGISFLFNPLKGLETFRPSRGFYNFTPRRKGRLFKFYPKEVERVRHWGTFGVEEELYSPIGEFV